MHEKSSGGFTLIELVITIALLGIAAATVVTVQGSLGKSLAVDSAAVNDNFALALAEACSEKVLASRVVLVGQTGVFSNAFDCAFNDTSSQPKNRFAPFTASVAVRRLAKDEAASTLVGGFANCPRDANNKGPACAEATITVSGNNQAFPSIWLLLVQR